MPAGLGVNAVALWFLLTILPGMVANAQPFEWERCDSCYRNYSYGADSTFLRGAISVPANLMELALDSFGIRLNVGYWGPTRLALPSSHHMESDTRAKLEEARRLGTKIIFPPAGIAHLLKYACLTTENYVGSYPDGDSIQAMISGYASPQGRADTTVRARHHVWGWRDDRTSGVHHQMVGKPRFTSNLLVDSNHHSTEAYAQRNWLGSGERRDSTSYVRVTFTIAADSLALQNRRIADSAVIAFGVIYRRDTAGQASCRCANYVVVDSVKITKGMLTDRNREDAGDGFSNFHSRYYHVPTDFPKLPGRFSNTESDRSCVDLCARLRAGSTRQIIDERDDRYNDIVEGSERLVHRFYTTRRVPVRYLRASISQHSFEVLKNHGFDSIIKGDVDAVFDSTGLFTGYAGFGVVDEPALWNFRAWGIVSSRIQDFRNARSPLDSRMLYSIVYASYGGLRAFSGDIDSTRYKLMQAIITNDYFTEGHFPIPVTYANPDRMSGTALTHFYRADDDSTGSDGVTWRQKILYNVPDDHARYLASLNSNTVRSQIGNFHDSRTWISSTRGPFLPNLARAIDVSRYRNSGWGPASPVYPVVTIHGYLDVAPNEKEANHYNGTFLIRPPTPEEITVQCWIALNCNADGIIYSNFDWDGRALGIIERATGHHGAEYAALKKPNDSTNINWWTDTMWVGFASRFAAVKRFSTEMALIEPVYRRLDYRREQMSVHDRRQSFDEIPMVADLRAERAYRDTIRFVGTGRFDPRDSTYLELTHYHPGVRDNSGTRYLLITNRRCWPIDHGTYSDYAAHGGSRRGLGNIDVRRPWVELKNSIGVAADSFIVEKVGRESEWSRTIPVGQLEALDWLEPGWGQLYRIRPVMREKAEEGDRVR